jgi:hypothetical protein
MENVTGVFDRYTSNDGRTGFYRQSAMIKLLCYKRQEGNVTGTFDRDSQRTLVLGTGSRLAPRANTPEFIGKAIQHLSVFVIDHIYFIDTECTDTTPGTSTSSSSLGSRSLHFNLRL